MKARALLAVVASMTLLPNSPAAAGIVCRDGYQQVGGNEISTPYCRDSLIAHVASQRGRHVSAEFVRSNPNYKEELCRWVGSDTRLGGVCNSNSGDGRSK